MSGNPVPNIAYTRVVPNKKTSFWTTNLLVQRVIVWVKSRHLSWQIMCFVHDLIVHFLMLDMQTNFNCTEIIILCIRTNQSLRIRRCIPHHRLFADRWHCVWQPNIDVPTLPSKPFDYLTRMNRIDTTLVDPRQI